MDALHDVLLPPQGSAMPRRWPRGRARWPAPASARGLTLIELMVTLAVLVVVLAVSAPGMAEFSANNRQAATKTAFSGAVALARSEAARRGQSVVLAAVSGGVSGNELAKGWELVADDDGNGEAGDSEPRLRQYPALDNGVRLSGIRNLVFRATGALSTTTAAVYTICRSDGATQGFSLTVGPSGVADVAAINTCSP